MSTENCSARRVFKQHMAGITANFVIVGIQTANVQIHFFHFHHDI